MTYKEKTMRGIPAFFLEGKIMGGTAECTSLCNRLKELIAAGSKHIVIDFTDVRWINSNGIGFMLSCVTSMRRNGGDVFFTGVNERVAHYLKITKLDTVLRVFADVEEIQNTISSSEAV
jgi:anti-sigma B factor antagonist